MLELPDTIEKCEEEWVVKIKAPGILFKFYFDNFFYF